MNANKVLLVVAAMFTIAVVTGVCSERWSAAQIDELRSLSLPELEPLPADPTNRVADDPRAAAFGEWLFFDTRLSSNGKVSCGTCHVPEKGFQDGTALANGVGTTARRTMPIAATARAPFLFWDGRKDSQWSQALGPLESAVEHGGTREQYARLIAEHYEPDYTAIFGPLPDLAGGRDVVTAVLADEFNCKSKWSDARDRCSELEYLVTGEHELERAFKVPSLRDVAERAPYMHAGQLATLADVLEHYNRAPAAPKGHSELKPLRLKKTELAQLEAFLRTLSASPRTPVVSR